MPTVTERTTNASVIEHVRLISSSDIARHITETFVEDYIAEANPAELITIEDMTTPGNENIYEDMFGSESDYPSDEHPKPIGTVQAILSLQVVRDASQDVGRTPGENTNQIEEIHLTST